jgi:hypothetical protein
MMRKTAMVLVLLSLAGLAARAQERGHFSLGLGIEENWNARQGAALGGVFRGEGGYGNVGVGGRLGFSYDFDGLMSPDLAVLVRYYFFGLEKVFPFVQGGFGVNLFIEESRVKGAFLAEGGAGVRIPLENFYLEPYVRGGYPFIWGFGIIAGYRRDGL